MTDEGSIAGSSKRGLTGLLAIGCFSIPLAQPSSRPPTKEVSQIWSRNVQMATALALATSFVRHVEYPSTGNNARCDTHAACVSHVIRIEPGSTDPAVLIIFGKALLRQRDHAA